ncbi:MAG: glyoxalase superfamily protein [Pseudomonadota bacterium]
MIRSATPVVRTGDYVKANAFYTNVLGFTCTEEGGEPPKFGIFKREGAVIFVNGHNGADVEYDHWRAYFHVDDIENLSKEFRDAGGVLKKDIFTTVYGMREFEVTDPDGNVLCFGADV